MKKVQLNKLIARKQRAADKHNRLIYLEIKKGRCINAYDIIKKEYVEGKHGSLTETQLEMILNKCLIQGRGFYVLQGKQD